MKTHQYNRPLNKTLAVLSGAVMSLSLTTGSVLAAEVSDEDYKTLQSHKQKEAEKQQPPHQRPAPASPSHPGAAPTANLAEAATNPVSNMVQFQIQDVYNWDNHNSSGYGNNVIIQPVIPISLPWEAVPTLITRTTIPYVSTPDLGSPVNRKHGFGDTVALGLFLPKLKTKGVQLGLGYIATLPTAGDNEFTGSGKWQAGPSFIYINMQTKGLQWGLFAHQSWSVYDAQQQRESVSKLALQPFITYHMKGGWYVGSPDSPQTYDFKKDKWTWALGGQWGKVTKVLGVPSKLFVEILNNPENNAGPTANWTAKFNITLLFPE